MSLPMTERIYACLFRGNVDCFVNDNNLVECKECPNGKRGITCDEEATVQTEEEGKTNKTEKAGKSEETKEEEKEETKKKDESEKHEEEQPSAVEEEDRSEEKPEKPTEPPTSEVVSISKDVTIDENKVEETF
ncbi:hypothetical protein OESDEN_23338 [Oesophagostomum dentatum]|uniref:Laminin EGF-like domain-containing protein n=1 Tax=Oesophagostomum dentatum TaxID=61180 RepID=A0A0B1S0P5_OESDE|nr:hypothetical protein OESDEN_23338 [Oesophagostomum dentatum]